MRQVLTNLSDLTVTAVNINKNNSLEADQKQAIKRVFLQPQYFENTFPFMVSLCLFIALFAVYSYQTYASSKQAETLANLQKRMDQYLAQVGQKKKQVAETNEVLSSKEFMQDFLKKMNQMKIRRRLNLPLLKIRFAS